MKLGLEPWIYDLRYHRFTDRKHHFLDRKLWILRLDVQHREFYYSVVFALSGVLTDHSSITVIPYETVCFIFTFGFHETNFTCSRLCQTVSHKQIAESMIGLNELESSDSTKCVRFQILCNTSQ